MADVLLLKHSPKMTFPSLDAHALSLQTNLVVVRWPKDTRFIASRSPREVSPTTSHHPSSFTCSKGRSGSQQVIQRAVAWKLRAAVVARQQADAVKQRVTALLQTTGPLVPS